MCYNDICQIIQIQLVPYPVRDRCGNGIHMEQYTLTILPQGIRIPADEDQILLKALREAGLRADAPCGGAGTCGKCIVLADGRDVLSCQTLVDDDMTIELPGGGEE